MRIRCAWPSSPHGAPRARPCRSWCLWKDIAGPSRTFETAKTGLDHNETRSLHGWHRHVSLVMLVFAVMAVICHRANTGPLLKKSDSGLDGSLIVDPLVDPRNPAPRHEANPAAHPARPHPRMVVLSQGPLGQRAQSHLKKSNCNASARTAIKSDCAEDAKEHIAIVNSIPLQFLQKDGANSRKPGRQATQRMPSGEGPPARGWCCRG